MDRVIVVFDFKRIEIFFSCKFFPIFGHKNPGSGSDPDWIGIQPKMLDPDPYQMNTDPKP
jgi:hypothetical protein